jgi:RNA polymerase sigma factor (sigma-70 family)
MVSVKKHILIPDDSRIFDGIKNLDKFYEDALYVKYYEEFLDYGQSKCNYTENSQDLPHDLVQDTFIIAIEKIRDGSLTSNHEGHVFNWLKKTFKNKLSNWRKKEGRLPRNSTESEAPIPDFLKEEEEEEIPYIEILTKALEKLDNKCREVIIAFYYRNMSMRDLEKKFSYISSERNARQYKFRCMDKLKKKTDILLNDYHQKS